METVSYKLQTIWCTDDHPIVDSDDFNSYTITDKICHKDFVLGRNVDPPLSTKMTTVQIQ